MADLALQQLTTVQQETKSIDISVLRDRNKLSFCGSWPGIVEGQRKRKHK